MKPEWKVYVITVPMYNRWERNTRILISAGNKLCLYIQTLQHRLSCTVHTDMTVWIAFALRPDSSFLASLLPYYISWKGMPQTAMVLLSIQRQQEQSLSSSSLFLYFHQQSVMLCKYLKLSVTQTSVVISKRNYKVSFFE